MNLYYIKHVKEVAWLGEAIAGGATILSSLIGKKSNDNANAVNLEAVERTNQTNRAIATETNKTNQDIATQYNNNQRYLADRQNDWNIAQWNRENAYNTPLAQRQRLEEAGLNPYFFGIDGNSASTGLQAVTPDQQMATVENGAPMEAGQITPFMPDWSGAGQTISNSLLQKRALNLQERKQYEEILNMRAERDYQEFLTHREKGTEKEWIEKRKLENDDLRMSIRQKRYAIKLNKEQIKNLKVDKSIKDILLKYSDAEHSAGLAVTLQNAQLLAHNISLVDAKIKTEQSQQNLNNASAESARQQANYYQAQTDESEQRLNHALATNSIEEAKTNAVNKLVQMAAENGIILGASDAENLMTQFMQIDKTNNKDFSRSLNRIITGLGYVQRFNPISYISGFVK